MGVALLAGALAVPVSGPIAERFGAAPDSDELGLVAKGPTLLTGVVTAPGRDGRKSSRRGVAGKVSVYLEQPLPDGSGSTSELIASGQADARGILHIPAGGPKAMPPADELVRNPDGSVTLEVVIDRRGEERTINIDAVPPQRKGASWTWGAVADPGFLPPGQARQADAWARRPLAGLVLPTDGVLTKVTGTPPAGSGMSPAVTRSYQALSTGEYEISDALPAVRQQCQHHREWRWIPGKTIERKVPIIDVQLKRKASSDFQVESTRGTKIQTVYSVAGDLAGTAVKAGLTYSSEQSSTFGFTGSHNPPRRKRPFRERALAPWKIGVQKLMCAEVYGPLLTPTGDYFDTGKRRHKPKRWTGDILRTRSYTEWVCYPAYRNRVAYPVYIRNGKTRVFSRFASSGGVSIDSSQTVSRSMTHKISKKRGFRTMHVCGWGGRWDNAPAIQETYPG